MNTKQKRTKETITLGSGFLYIMEFDGKIPEHAEFEIKEKMLGRIQGGATLNYSAEFHEETDDHQIVSKKMIKSETVVLKSGILTWNAEVLNRLVSTGRVSEDGNTRTLKLGGASNYDGKKYAIRFLHKDKEDGDIRITLVGSNEAGLEFSFAKDKGTVINVEFKAQSMDDEGTLVLFEEEIVEASVDSSESSSIGEPVPTKNKK